MKLLLVFFSHMQICHSVLAGANQGGCLVLRLTELPAQALVLFQEFLNRGGLVSQVHAEILALSL